MPADALINGQTIEVGVGRGDLPCAESVEEVCVDCMKRILRIRIWMSSFAALLSCVYVHLCTSIVLQVFIFCNIAVSAAIEIFLPLQKYVFIVPFIGILIALAFPKFRRTKYLFLVPDILYGFAVAWIFAAMILWLPPFAQSVGKFLNK